MTVQDEAYCWRLAYFFFGNGLEPEDIAQEAMIAMWFAPHAPRLAARRQVLDVVKIANRQVFFAELAEPVQDPRGDVVDLVDARLRLRAVLEADLTDNERVAVGRRLRGEPIRRGEHALDMAWYRARQKLAA